ncbi:MAG: FliH/SctL family protein [Paracoccaceae bacterium]
MSNLAEEFVTLDKENHVRMRGAIKTAISADFKVEESPKHNSSAGFSRKSIEFFVREKIDPASFPKSEELSSKNARPAAEADHSSHDVSSEAPQNSEPTAAPQSGENSDLDDLAQVLAEESTEPAPDIELNQETTEQPVNPQATVDDQQSDLYDEGFAAGRAAALSELEEQRLEHLGVLKSISEKLLTDSVFDFDNISKKVLDTVNELSSERCGLAIDENPEGFLKRIAAQIEQVRNLSEERSVFFNEEDLAALKSFEEFESYFAKAKVRSDPVLKRGDVVVKVGGVELRDAPFADYAQDIQDE